MDYGKLDAALAAALEEIQDPEQRALEVFVATTGAPGAAETDFLQGLGVSGAATGRQVFTARLSARAVAELSEQPWVRSLKLSQKLRAI